jgi:GNAT superfamily N-acetyltransferase
MTPVFRSHYWDDAPAKAEFIRLTKEVHGLDLSTWDERGFWDDAFVPFSFFLEGRIISNVGVYRVPMRIAGRNVIVSQISSVATAPEHRRKGLNRELTARALAWSREQGQDFAFLFADTQAYRYYRNCGFRHTRQHSFKTLAPPPGSSQTARKLNPRTDRDEDLIHQIAKKRTPVSDQLGSRSHRLLMFHALYRLREFAYWLADLEAVVFADQRGSNLILHDVVAETLPPLAEVVARLPFRNIQAVDFGFMPDRFVGDEAVARIEDADGAHILGDRFPFFGQPFRFPHTSCA